MQQPLVIPKLFRKNNSHKNPGLSCSRLPVQGQEYLSLSFFYNPLSFSISFLRLLSHTHTHPPPPHRHHLFFLSLNLINSFSSYQDGIRQKRLFGHWKVSCKCVRFSLCCWRNADTNSLSPCVFKSTVTLLLLIPLRDDSMFTNRTRWEHTYCAVRVKVD